MTPEEIAALRAVMETASGRKLTAVRDTYIRRLVAQTPRMLAALDALEHARPEHDRLKAEIRRLRRTLESYAASEVYGAEARRALEQSYS